MEPDAADADSLGSPVTDAMAFANRVAEAANAANHHPDIHVEGYKNVRIVLTTHLTGGISDADVALAKRIDALEQP